MWTRRAALAGLGSGLGLAAGGLRAQDRYDLAELLRFDSLGQVTLLYLADLGGLFEPHLYRPASRRLLRGGPEDLRGVALRVRYGVGGRGPLDHALTAESWDDLAPAYGAMGGLPQIARLVGAVRQARPQSLLLMGGESLGGPLARMGARRAERALLAGLAPSLVARPGRRGAWSVKLIRHGSFVLHIVELANDFLLEDVTALEGAVKALAPAGPVLLVSPLGLAADRLLAERLPGLALILSRGVPLPEVARVAGVPLVAAGSQGRFLARIDLAVEGGRVVDLSHRLIPVFADLVPPLPATLRALRAVRAPLRERLSAPLGVAPELLESAEPLGNGWSRLITAALQAQAGAELALIEAPLGGHTVGAGMAVTAEDLLSVTGGLRFRVAEVTGAELLAALEAGLAAVLAPAGLPARGAPLVGGLSFTLAQEAAPFVRDPWLAQSGKALDPAGRYRLARVGQGVAGAPLGPLVARHLAAPSVESRPGVITFD